MHASRLIGHEAFSSKKEYNNFLFPICAKPHWNSSIVFFAYGVLELLASISLNTILTPWKKFISSHSITQFKFQLFLILSKINFTVLHCSHIYTQHAAIIVHPCSSFEPKLPCFDGGWTNYKLYPTSICYSEERGLKNGGKSNFEHSFIPFHYYQHVCPHTHKMHVCEGWIGTMDPFTNLVQFYGYLH